MVAFTSCIRRSEQLFAPHVRRLQENIDFLVARNQGDKVSGATEFSEAGKCLRPDTLFFTALWQLLLRGELKKLEYVSARGLRSCLRLS